MDRFIIVEMDVLTDDEEFGLLQYMFPNVDPELLKLCLRYLTPQEWSLSPIMVS